MPKRAGGVASAVLGVFKPSSEQVASLTPAPGGATVTTLTAPEDPATPSSQTVERLDEKTDVVPVVVERVTETKQLADGAVTTTVKETLAPTPVTRSRSLQKSTTQIGVSQINTAAATSAKLSSWRPVQYLGIVLILGALVAFHPVVFLAIGKDRTLQAIAGASGIGLIMLPSIVVGNEKLLIYIGLGIVATLVAWYFIRENGRLQGFVDKDKNGIDDRTQSPTK